jgi:hypothetical protein
VIDSLFLFAKLIHLLSANIRSCLLKYGIGLVIDVYDLFIHNYQRMDQYNRMKREEKQDNVDAITLNKRKIDRLKSDTFFRRITNDLYSVICCKAYSNGIVSTESSLR